MAGDKEIIVAIEFGSSKIRGIAGCMNIDGSMQVLDIVQVDARNCIRKGVIYNIDKTTLCLRRLIDMLEEALNVKVRRAYVGISGQSLRTKRNTVSRQFATKTVVSQEMVDSLLKDNSNNTYPGYEVLEVVPQKYRVGADSTLDPVGVLGNQIEGTFLNVVARSEIKEYVLKCIEANGLEVAGLYISPMALASCVLSENEKRSGCALLDFGYGTTTLAIYKNNLLRYLSVLPLGGHNITLDLCSLQIEEDEAESLKMKYGTAFVETTNSEKTKNLLLSSGYTIEDRKLTDVVEAREEEIIKNIGTQLKNSKFGNGLLGGIVVTGGASNMKGLDKALAEYLKADKVRFVKIAPFALQADHPEQLVKDGSLNTLLALLTKGNMNCVEEKPQEQTEEAEEPVGEEVLVAADEQQTETEQKPEEVEEKKKDKNSFWKRMRERIEALTRTVTEE